MSDKKDVETRKAELKRLLESEGKYTFAHVQKETERIMGRPVWTHEFAEGVIQYLYDELDGKTVPSMMDKIFILRGTWDGIVAVVK